MPSAEVDLLLWSAGNSAAPPWGLGGVSRLPRQTSSACKELADWAAVSNSEYALLWSDEQLLPDPALILSYIREGIDVVHCGLKQGTGELWPSLQLIIHNWSIINASVNNPSSSWRLGLEACLIRRDLLRQIGGIDTAFLSLSAAGLELGYRCLKMGALVEHRPELCPPAAKGRVPEPPPQDLYTFVLRHFGERWAKYLLVRRGLERFLWLSERRYLQGARRSSAAAPAPAAVAKPVWYGAAAAERESLRHVPVTAIIPTLGRYPYLPDALNSLRRQTVKPREVIIVDQNPQGLRQPQLYEGYEDLNLKVIWQDKRGQSLARNTGLAVAKCPLGDAEASSTSRRSSPQGSI